MKDLAAIATTMNPFFVNITQTIELKQLHFVCVNNQLEDHTNIISIKSNLDNVSGNLDFKEVHEKEVKREIMKLYTCVKNARIWNYSGLHFPHSD